MNRHERRRARALGPKAYAEDPKARDEHNRGAEKHFAMFKHMLSRLPPEDPPRFALLPKEIGMVASLDDPALYDTDGAHKLARNYTAAIVINSLLLFAEAEGIEPPTYRMLRVFVEETRLETDSVSIGELGLRPIGTSGKWGVS